MHKSQWIRLLFVGSVYTGATGIFAFCLFWLRRMASSNRAVTLRPTLFSKIINYMTMFLTIHRSNHFFHHVKWWLLSYLLCSWLLPSECMAATTVFGYIRIKSCLHCTEVISYSIINLGIKYCHSSHHYIRGDVNLGWERQGYSS